MSNLAARIEELDDKQACYVATKLGGALLGKWKGAPNLGTLATWADEAFTSNGSPLELSQNTNWGSEKMRGIQAGDAARLVLSAWASNTELAPAVAAALEHYPRDEKADLGIFSIPLAIGLAYVLIAGEVDIDLGFIKIKKKGLSAEQQKDVAPKLLTGLAGTIRPSAQAAGSEASVKR
jgi:hypothetical protein